MIAVCFCVNICISIAVCAVAYWGGGLAHAPSLSADYNFLWLFPRPPGPPPFAHSKYATVFVCILRLKFWFVLFHLWLLATTRLNTLTYLLSYVITSLTVQWCDDEGVLVYSHQEGVENGDYIVLNIVDGRLQLRYNLGSGAANITYRLQCLHTVINPKHGGGRCGEEFVSLPLPLCLLSRGGTGA